MPNSEAKKAANRAYAKRRRARLRGSVVTDSLPTSTDNLPTRIPTHTDSVTDSATDSAYRPLPTHSYKLISEVPRKPRPITHESPPPKPEEPRKKPKDEGPSYIGMDW